MPKPSHHLITSGSLAQLETRLFSSIRDAKRDDPFRPLVVLCGSRFLGHYLARQLARAGSPHAAIQFLTLNDLARQLAGESGQCGSGAISTGSGGSLGVQALPAGAKELVTRGLLAAMRKGYFSKVQDQPHLPEVLAATFTDVEDSGADLAKPAWPVKLSHESKRKVAEVASLYTQYRKHVAEAKLMSEADLLARAATHAGEFVARLGADFLSVYGFYELTNAQCELWLALARHVSVSAYLFVEEDRRFKTAHRLRDRLIREISPAVENYDREAPSTDLIAARSWVFTPRSEAREPDGSLAVLSCPNEGQRSPRDCTRMHPLETRSGDRVHRDDRAGARWRGIFAAAGGGLRQHRRPVLFARGFAAGAHGHRQEHSRAAPIGLHRLATGRGDGVAHARSTRHGSPDHAVGPHQHGSRNCRRHRAVARQTGSLGASPGIAGYEGAPHLPGFGRCG